MEDGRGVVNHAEELDKSAQTNGVTFSAIDAKRADKKFYDLTYEALEKGEIVNKSDAATVDWD